MSDELNKLLDAYKSSGGTPKLKSEFKASVETPPLALTAQAEKVPYGAYAPNYDVAYYKPIKPRAIKRAAVYSCQNGAVGSTSGNLVISPQRMFKALGITVFGVSPKTKVSCAVGIDSVFYGIHAEFFECKCTYQEMKQIAERGDHNNLPTSWRCLLQDIVDGRASWMPEIPTCLIAQMISVQYNGGPLEAVVIWGDEILE